MLIDIGEQEGWVTAHASSARIITPYENEMVMMHEGASGGGKSELLQDVMRSGDGRVLLGVNLVSGEESYISMSDTCTIEPVTDDMAMCPPSIRTIRQARPHRRRGRLVRARSTASRATAATRSTRRYR